LCLGPPRRSLLNLLLPAIFVIFFGGLSTAVKLSPRAYDWRRQSISWLLYPYNDPNFHVIASLAVAATGLLMVPCAAYIRAQLTSTSMTFTNLGALLLSLGAVLLILAGLIVSHPYTGTASFPRLHETLARGAALALGMGMVMLWLSAIRIWFTSRLDWALHLRALLIAWTLLIAPAIAVVSLRLLARAERGRSSGMLGAIANRHLWHLGFWEWTGAGAVFLFLLSSALFLPERAVE
jgi:hypothetical protein